MRSAGGWPWFNTKQRAIASVRSLPAHNIRGLAFAPDGQTLLIAHQVLNRLAQTSFDDVHWGLLIRNHLRVARQTPFKAGTDRRGAHDPAETDDRRAPTRQPRLLDGGRLLDLGDVGYAAGDPGAIAFDRRGHVIVALSGMDEVAIAAGLGQGPHRIVVGRRPIALATSPDGEFVYVADSLDDTISVITIATGQRPATIGLGPRPEPSAADRGERLFSSAKLSHDGWMSCQSCHTDGHTNSLLSDTLGDGSYGAPEARAVAPGRRHVPAPGPGPAPWPGWTTRSASRSSTTMHGPKPTDGQVADLIAYLESLEPPSPKLWRAGP